MAENNMLNSVEASTQPCSCRAVKIMSIVPLFFLNPHWLSGRSPDRSRCSFNRFSRTLARIFPAIDNKDMLWWLSQTWGFPFLLNRWIIVASLNSWGMASFLHIMWNNSVSLQLEDWLLCRSLQVLHLILEPCQMTGVLLLSLFQRRLGAHQAADYIPPVVVCWELHHW